MTAAEILAEVIGIITGGITDVAAAMGQGISTLVSNIAFTGTGSDQQLSVFFVLVLVFAGIALALGLCRAIVKFVTGLGKSRSV